jgi:hypothetical protein
LTENEQFFTLKTNEDNHYYFINLNDDYKYIKFKKWLKENDGLYFAVYMFTKDNRNVSVLFLKFK